MLKDLKVIKDELLPANEANNINNKEISIIPQLEQEINNYLRLKENKSSNKAIVISKKIEITNLIKHSKLDDQLSNKYLHLLSTTSTPFSATEIEMQTRREERRKQQKISRELKKGNQKGNQKGKKDDIQFISINIQEDTPQTIQYIQKVDNQLSQQDELLDQINNGLSDLKELATDANKKLSTNSAMLDQLSNKIDDNLTKFKTTNSRLKDMLEQSGGLSRWCPISICIIILLSLGGYIFRIL